MDYDVDFDEELTLFVGKNNAGKTSLMNLMDGSDGYSEHGY